MVADTFGLELDGPAALAELEGIRCVAGGDLTIRGVSDLAAAGTLEQVEGGVLVLDNQDLTSLDGLSSLTHVGGTVAIDANPALVDLDGLTGLVSVAGPLKIGVASNPIGWETSLGSASSGRTPFPG